MDNWYYKKPVGYNVPELGNADDILDTTEYPDNMRKVAVFDDLVKLQTKYRIKLQIIKLMEDITWLVRFI